MSRQASPARRALLRLLGDGAWHPWWQIEQVAGVLIDPRMAARSYIRQADFECRVAGREPDGEARFRAAPQHGLTRGTRIMLGVLLRQMQTERRGPRGRGRYRIVQEAQSDRDKLAG